ncbi:FtsX-like permease family protein [Pontibacter sp. G13]|uniref:FtsX-like permease family protein n=1 Tax=Pontibacter sp. G13 TaxID=3074898 RepID=UPI00288B5F9A|nr:FtsX-like permease family protein [Pontibacter sp. G13]WNJ16362.1 FtsX-like permease family protein [Pontibacter sp. G13]
MHDAPQPPKWAIRWFEWFCSDDYREYILGDLYELFHERLESLGPKAARRRFVWDVLMLCRPFLWKRFRLNALDHLSYQTDMFRHYFIASFRNLKRQRWHTAINVLGLTLGFVCSLIIFLKIDYEWKVDTHHEDADRIFRMVRTDTEFGNTSYSVGSPYPMYDALKLDFQEECEVILQIDQNFRSILVQPKNGQSPAPSYKENDHLIFASEEFFEVFSYQWLQGDPLTALEAPNAAVISTSLAEQYFGTTDVLGKTLTLELEHPVTIQGVVADPPKTTGFPFKLIVNYAWRGGKPRTGEWGGTSSSAQVFVKLAPTISQSQFEELLPAFTLKHQGEYHAEIREQFLQPISDIHFNGELPSLDGRFIPKRTIGSLALVAILLLVIACINFINLNSVLVFRRAKEIGIRKVLGSHQSQLIQYFLTETLMITLFSFLAALAIVPVVLPGLSEILGTELVLDMQIFMSKPFMLYSLGTLLGVGLLAGAYPAWQLSRLIPSQTIKQQSVSGSNGQRWFRKVLITSQFAVGQALIVCTLVMARQVDYFHETPIGLDQAGVVEFDFANSDAEESQMAKQAARIKHELLSSPYIDQVTFSNTGSISSSSWSGNFSGFLGEKEYKTEAEIKAVEYGYFETYGIELMGGKNMSEGSPSSEVWINETLLKEFGFDQAEEVIGMESEVWGFEGRIVGVVKDFNTSSFHERLYPVMIQKVPAYHTGAMRIQTEHTQEAIAHLEKIWKAEFPQQVFEFRFLDDRIAEFYQEEVQSTKLFQLFSGIALLIGCLGLIGLISFVVTRRSKEIGIRKVLGASKSSIIWMFSTEYAWLILFGFLISAPVGYFAMSGWLEQYPYRVNWSGWEFGLALGITGLVALATVGLRAWKAATNNPVEALKNE